MRQLNHIMVVSTPDGAPDALLARVTWLAEASGARITVFGAMDTSDADLSQSLEALPSHRATEVTAQIVQYHQTRLEALASALCRAGFDVDTQFVRGDINLEVTRFAAAHAVDLVVKTADPTPIRRVLGAADIALLRSCVCSVWLLNSATEPVARRIVAAVDPDTVEATLNHEIIDMAATMARQDTARLDLMCAWHLCEETALRSRHIAVTDAELDHLLSNAETQSVKKLNRIVAKHAESSDLLHVMHVKGLPSEVIAEHAENERIDTLVIGAFREANTEFCRSTLQTETVLNRVGCSVVAMKPTAARLRTPDNAGQGAAAHS